MYVSYDALDNAISEATRTEIGFSQLLCPSPALSSPSLGDECAERLAVIRSFFSTTLKVFRAALAGDVHPDVLSFLLNDAPPQYRKDYYGTLPEKAWSDPCFFRTDEAVPGQILEVQAPGSMWGELQLLSETAGTAPRSLPANLFAEELRSLREHPVVHHLLDNASIPHTMRFFIERTREAGVSYYGISRGVGSGDCNFIRSHSVFGLLAENFFAARLQAARAGSLVFDLPPLLVLDQKAPLALPWWSLTREHYSDDVRAAFAYTTPITRAGFEFPTGELVSIEDFAALPQSERRWYLKYAGTDVDINWGSRGVYRLSNNGRAGCLQELADAVTSSTRTAWVVQPAIEARADVDVLDRSGELVTMAGAHSKFSAFYGPQTFFGSVLQYRGHFKVHGKEDTAIALVQASA